jgi:hypothetical protein
MGFGIWRFLRGREDADRQRMTHWRFADGLLAHVKTPGTQKALRNHVFDSLGLPRIYIAS